MSCVGGNKKKRKYSNNGLCKTTRNLKNDDKDVASLVAVNDYDIVQYDDDDIKNEK